MYNKRPPKPGLRETYRKLGPTRFFAITFALLGWIGGGLWLTETTGFDETYGFACHGRGCFFVEVWNSPKLIEHGGYSEFALFCWLWSMPALVLAVWGWALWKKIKHKRLNFSFFDDAPPS